MTTKILTTLLISAALTIQVKAQTTHTTPVQVGFIYPLSSNGVHSGEYTNHFSFNVLAGISGSEKGFAFAGISNIIRDSAKGFQLAGMSNIILDKARGVQLAGLVNVVSNEAKGAQLAGFANITGSSRGAQLAGFTNLVSGSADVQLAGFVNKAKKVAFQSAGFVNVAKKAHTQIAGFANVAKEVEGAQVAGFVNVAHKVNGVQLAGFVNIADSSDYPIGLVNIVKNGEKAIGITVDETQTTIVSFRSGGKVLYGIVGAGYNSKSEKALYALEAGFGAHIRVSRSLRLNLEATSLALSDFERGAYLRSSLAVLPAFRISHNIEVFAGPSFNVVTLSDNKGRDLTPHYTWSNQRYRTFNGLYFGGVAGVQVRF